MHVDLLRSYDKFAHSLRVQFIKQQKDKKAPSLSSPQTQNTATLVSQTVYRPMKFLTKPPYTTPNELYSGYNQVENYIDGTKMVLDEQLPQICKPEKSNLSVTQKKSLFKLKKQSAEITIKPADKNLGIVILDTHDYIYQCASHLNSNTYRLVQEYPARQIAATTESILDQFRQPLFQYSKRLFHYLRPKISEGQVPKFYGIPKIHKSFERIPPIRPIVAQCNSMLAPAAKFIDHVLQPLSQSYPDYLQNTTSLVLLLDNMQIPDDAILVTVDVESLYPSIPQSECIDIIYNEMQANRHLMLFDPNLIIHLLHTNITNNFFTFATYIFQQTTGTAMGAAFSPTIANIFMSVFIRKFLNTQKIKPLILKRYIDDIFFIWANNLEELVEFLSDLNKFHPSIHFTHQHSSTSIDFLEITIFKGTGFDYTNLLDIKTYQKARNLYQYLHYTSEHPRSVFKGLIRGECIRYLRTNTLECDFNTIIAMFKMRLHQRGYPNKLVDKYTSIVKFSQRQRFLQTAPPRTVTKAPIFSCLPPPQYNQLKVIILSQYTKLQRIVPRPKFIHSRHKTLGQDLVKAEVQPTDEQFLDIALILQAVPTAPMCHIQLPNLRMPLNPITPCRNSRCATCNSHLICSNAFKCTKTEISYPIRHRFTCKSANVVYLITCTKCRKQYVGITTNQLSIRINQHRTNILRKIPIYISKHFNLPSHSLANLRVQPIDKASSCTELQELEHYWINTLKTLQPSGLNVKP